MHAEVGIYRSELFPCALPPIFFFFSFGGLLFDPSLPGWCWSAIEEERRIRSEILREKLIKRPLPWRGALGFNEIFYSPPYERERTILKLKNNQTFANQAANKLSRCTELKKNAGVRHCMHIVYY